MATDILRYSLFVAATLVLVVLIASATRRSARLLADWPDDRNPLLIPGENIFRLILIAVCLGLGALSGLPPDQLGWRWDVAPGAVLGAAAAGLCLALVYYGGTRWIVARTGYRYYSPQLIRIIVPRSPRSLIALTLVMATVVLVEELIFRSLLIGGLQPLLPAWLLVAASSALFGLMHSPQGPWGMFGVTLGGLLLGWMFLASGSLLPPLICHYVTNIVQIGAAYRLQRLGLL